jgi:hypothetical protein
LPLKPVLAPNTKVQQSPSLDKEPAPKRWTFGFSHFRQIERFGLDRTDRGWFVSFLEKLRILSAEIVDDFISDGEKKGRWRFHPIDWTAYEIPIQLEVLDWLPADVRNNQVEFPLHQFQVSMALGRVVGYFDEDQVFQVVLLDPWHNIQPSKSHNYRVDPCSPLSCDYSNLLARLTAAREYECSDGANCAVKEALQNVHEKPLMSLNIVLMKPDDDAMKNAVELIKNGHAASLEDIFVLGTIQLMLQSSNPTEG